MRKIIIDTHEYVRAGVKEQMDNLQEIPLHVISLWMEKFKESQVYYIADVEQEQGTPAYDILREQKVERLLAVPFKKKAGQLSDLWVWIIRPAIVTMRRCFLPYSFLSQTVWLQKNNRSSCSI